VRSPVTRVVRFLVGFAVRLGENLLGMSVATARPPDILSPSQNSAFADELRVPMVSGEVIALALRAALCRRIQLRRGLQ
jgi:hypothetical protein